jgi:hypothetical protein
VVVIDASIAVDLCLAAEGFAPLASEDLVAPPLILDDFGWAKTYDAEYVAA